jgi:diacylglycerol kinase family enzyme
MTEPSVGALPAFVNARAGSAEKAREAIEDVPGIALKATEPERLDEELRAAAAAGVPRVLVAGGDGTIASAAAALAGTRTALAILPGGTLNHFARDHEIPTEPGDALRLAIEGSAAPVDVGYVNDRLFLNTSSLGAYVRFVRLRDDLEKRLGYRLASLVAAMRVMATLRSYRVTLMVEGQERTYRTPVLFIGVQERELKVPTLGGRVKDGRRGLHVLVVRGGPLRRIVGIALMALVRGVREAGRTRWLDEFIVEKCRVDIPRHGVAVAVDGELVPLEAPFEYRLARDALQVVQP